MENELESNSDNEDEIEVYEYNYKGNKYLVDFSNNKFFICICGILGKFYHYR